MAPTGIEVKYDTSPLGTGKNWVTKMGGLPLFIRAVAHAFKRSGLDTSAAVRKAVGVVEDWAAGRMPNGKGKPSAKTVAKAQAAIAEFHAKAKGSRAKTAAKKEYRMAERLDIKGLTVTSELALPNGDAVLVLDDGRHALRASDGTVTEMKAADGEDETTDYDPGTESGDDAGGDGTEADLEPEVQGDLDAVVEDTPDLVPEDIEVGDDPESKGLLAPGDEYDDGVEFKRDFSTEERSKLAKTGSAMSDGSFPIKKTRDVVNAVRQIGRTPANRRPAVRKHIVKRARALGAMSKIPSHWPEKHNAGTKALNAGESKMYPYLPGSVEERQGMIADALNRNLLPPPQTDDNGRSMGSPGYVSIDGTYADQVIATVRLWNDPEGTEPRTFAIPYTIDDSDEVQLGEAVPVEKIMAIVPDTTPGDEGSGSGGGGSSASTAEDTATGQAAQQQASATKGLLDAILVRAATGDIEAKSVLDKLAHTQNELAGLVRESHPVAREEDGKPDGDKPEGDGDGDGIKAVTLSDAERILMEAQAFGIEIPQP